MSGIADTFSGPAAETIRIVIADDDRLMRSVLSYRLKKAGFEVATAENGREAIELVTENTMVVLLDLYMPEMDGLACLQEIRRRFRDISPIMITASDDVSDAVVAMKYGAFDYLMKPVDSDKLLALVNKAVENWHHSRQFHQMRAELKKAREREIAIASRIQQTLLTGRKPQNLPGITLGQLTIPSQSVDGDFFDFFRLDSRSLDIVVGDVMGKGVAPALLGAATKSHFLRVINEMIIERQCRRLPEPEEIVTRLHASMIAQIEAIETFVTLCYARIDLEKSRLSLVDCGHVRTIHYCADAGEIRLLEGVNAPLGLPELGEFRQISVVFGPGDFFFFYSDGLTETGNPEGDLYGEERLAGLVLRNAGKDPDSLIHCIRQELVRYSGRESFDDDFTCVVAAIDRQGEKNGG